MKIGNVEIAGKTALAPMAGVTDHAYRTICRRFGASYAVTEMVSGKGLLYNDRKSVELLNCAGETPVGAQLFGSEPEVLRKAAPLALKLSHADILDINMGCPMPKITGNGEGSALMKTPELAAAIVRAVKDAVRVPVTVKFRLGWDSFTAEEFARTLEAAGADALCIHGRTREQYYGGSADWDAMTRVVKAVQIPVMVSGDVTDAESAKTLMEQSGAALCMIGRATYGNPWIFGQAEAALSGKEIPPTPDFHEKILLAREHMALAVSEKGERRAVAESRHHIAWYCKGIPGAAAMRARMNSLTTAEEMFGLLDELARM